MAELLAALFDAEEQITMVSKSFDLKMLLPSVSDPVYKEAERLFVVGHIFQPHRVKRMARKVDHARFEGWNYPQIYLDRIRAGWRADGLSYDGAKAVIEAVKTHGLDAIGGRKEQGMHNPRAEVLSDLSVEILKALGHWRRLVQQGSKQQRHWATRCLKQFGQVLIPDTRGKKWTTEVNADKVKIWYYKELFRLLQIRNALRQLPSKNFSKRVRDASERFDMPVQQIKELWRLDEESQITTKPLTTKEMARILTARHFAITQQRVSNIIAS
jgi:hypothetical protein